MSTKNWKETKLKIKKTRTQTKQTGVNQNFYHGCQSNLLIKFVTAMIDQK